MWNVVSALFAPLGTLDNNNTKKEKKKIYIAYIHTPTEHALSDYSRNRTWTEYEGQKNKQQY